MRAIILAAGRGSRLGSLTDKQPKALTILKEKPLIQWQIEALNQAGIYEIAIVTGYLSSLLNSYGTHHFYNPRWAETNMLSSLWIAKEWLLKDVCIISYSDIVYEPAIIKALIDDPDEVAISYDPLWLNLWQKRFDDPLIDAETFRLDSKWYLKTIGDKPNSIDEIEGQYMGLLKFAPCFWKNLKFPPLDCDQLSLTAFLKRSIENGVAIKGIENKGLWMEIDTQRDLDIAEKLW
jgi:choline kinase